jgi:hypothetical protein
MATAKLDFNFSLPNKITQRFPKYIKKMIPAAHFQRCRDLSL